MGRIQKWFIGGMNTYTNEAVQAELQKRPGITWNERFMPVKGFQELQPVIEFDSYEFLKWLKKHRAGLNLEFKEYHQQFPDTPLVEYKLGKLKAGTRLVAEARAKRARVQTAP